MSNEVEIRLHVENELEISKRIYSDWEMQMTNTWIYLQTSGAVIEIVRDKYDQHKTMYNICMEEDDIFEIKRATVCMKMFTDVLMRQFNAEVRHSINWKLENLRL